MQEGLATLELDDIRDLCVWTLDEHGLTEKGWSFAWDRAVRRAGACHHARRQITLSQPIFVIEANRSAVLDTILHEVAHALVGVGAGHGPTWKAKAREIGARPERCHALSTPPLRVTGACGCTTAYERSRIPSRLYRCRLCLSPIEWSVK